MLTKKEIEIRAKLLNLDKVENFFDNNDIPKIYENHQIDTYFDNPSCTFFSNIECVYKWLRVRNENGKLTLNYKHWLPENEAIKTYCNETEFVLSNVYEMKNYLPKLGLKPEGFKPAIVVDKMRKSYVYKDCEISIDSVKNLGNYIEIEYKGENDSLKQIRNLLQEILKEIDAVVGEMDYKGYAYNLLKMKFDSEEMAKNDKL